MTTQEYVKKLNGKIQTLKSGKALNIASQSTHVKMVERVFEKGLDSDGEKHEYNSTDPLYINPLTDSPKKFPPKGKNGDTKFKNGKKHKTGYFKSYKAFREAIGYPADKMNLILFNIFHSDFGKAVIKINNESFVSTVTNEGNKGKLEKFSNYFKLNKLEKENFKDVLEFETLEILK